MTIVKVVEGGIKEFEFAAKSVGVGAARWQRFAQTGHFSLPADNSEQLQRATAVQEAASKHNIPPAFLWGIFGIETSHGTDIKTSSTGAMGAFQFEPATAKQYGYPMTNTPSNAQFLAQAEAAAAYLASATGNPGKRGNHTKAELDRAAKIYNSGSPKAGYGYNEVMAHAGVTPGNAAGNMGEQFNTAAANEGERAEAETAGLESPTSKFGELGLMLILILAGAFLLIYGIAIAVRPKERAMSNPFPAMKGTVLAGLGGYGGYGGA